jgi:DNA-binding CsgD family transcriptional regulator
MSDKDLINAIYEASSITERWPKILERLSNIAGCYGAALVAVNSAHDLRFIATDTMQSFMNVFIRDGWMARNSRAGRLISKRYAGFVTDLDIFTEQEIQKDPLYVEFLRPIGGGWGTGTIINIPCGDMVIFNLERAHKDGPVKAAGVKALDALRPHLARAAVLSARLGLDKARAMADMLGYIGLAGAVLGRRGQLIAANSEFQCLIGKLFWDRRERLTLCNLPADKMFFDGLQRIIDGSFTAPLSIPISMLGDQPPIIAHLVPVRGAANDIFSQATTVIYLTPVGRSKTAAMDALAALFDLTPAETRVAGCLIEGQSIALIADQSGRSPETVRSQIKSIFRKTGTERQSELVALLTTAVR